MLPDTILDFALLPVEVFILILFICDLEDWDKIKQEVKNIFALAFYMTGLILACLNFLLLGASTIISAGGDHKDALSFALFILLFTCLNVMSLFVSEYWKRKLRDGSPPTG